MNADKATGGKGNFFSTFRFDTRDAIHCASMKRHNHDQIQQSLNLKYPISCPLLKYILRKGHRFLLGGVKSSRILINLGIKSKASMNRLRNESLKSHFETDPWDFGAHQNVTAWNLGDKVYQQFFKEISRWCLQCCWHKDTHSPFQISPSML